MIANAVYGYFFAHKIGEGTANQRGLSFDFVQRNIEKSVGRTTGELACDVGLVRGQDAYAEMSRFDKDAVQPGIYAQTPLNERWVKRYRTE